MKQSKLITEKKGVTAITQNKKRVVLKLFAYEKWP